MAVTNLFEIFEGRLGGGKTYNATVRIIDRLRRGGVVATNIELNREEIAKMISSRWGVVPRLDEQLFNLTEDQIGDFYKHIPLGTGQGVNPLIVLDEFHLWFNSRDYGSTDKKHRPTLTFITQARKLHVDLLLISQSALNMDKQFVRQLHKIWRFRDLEKWVMPGLGFRMPFSKKFILAVEYDQNGRDLIERHWVKKDPEVFKCYETTALLRPILDLSQVKGQQLVLDRVDSRTILQKHMPTIKAVGFSLLVTTAIVIKMFTPWLNTF